MLDRQLDAISGNRPKRTPKEAVIALPPFLFFVKKGNACPKTGATKTGTNRSEFISKHF